VGCGTTLEFNLSIRPVKRLIKSEPTLEGAGVHFGRAFAFGNTKDFDSFLLLDDFGNDISEAYLAGFQWHPHRGIETITHCRARSLWGVITFSLSSPFSV
jgi:redox-sensitive bicupin YhaK (pirin superfamily)